MTLFSPAKLALVALPFAAAGLGLVCFELLARLLFGSPGDQQVLSLQYTAPNTFVRDECGAVQYQARRQIRTLAVYGGEVEWDVTFETNDAGYIDARDYGTGDADTLRVGIVGDSFTAGFHGGEPWVPKLQDLLDASGRRLEVLNLGVSGTGIAHFRNLLRCRYEALDLDHVIVAGITNDFWRFEWYPLEVENKVLFCAPGASPAECAGSESRLRTLPGSSFDLDDLLADAEAEFAALQRPPRPWHQQLYSLSAIRSFWKKTLFPPEPPSASVTILREIRDLTSAGKILFVHLPDKGEVRAGRYSADIEAVVRAAGLPYWPALDHCELTVDGFFPLDPHPNQQGYDRIAQCVARMMQDWMSGTGGA